MHAAVGSTSGNIHKTANIGDSVQLDCLTNDGSAVKWDFKTSGPMQPTTIYDGTHIQQQFATRFNVTFSGDTRRSSLIIADVRHRDAGVYVCLYKTYRPNNVLMQATLNVVGETSKSLLSKD